MSEVIKSAAGYSCIHWNNLPSEDQLKIFKALDRLAAGNPDIAKQLTGLADLKENSPKKYQAGLKFLKLT